MDTDSFRRLLEVPEHSFFLFGPRGVGKSRWLRDRLPEAHFVDLLDGSLYLDLARNPHGLEALVGPRPARSWVVLDEIQKLPALLDEAHRLMEARRWRFALCGSSARKLRRGGANLLAGRAVTRYLGPLSAAEMADAFDAPAAIDWGMLPVVVRDRREAPGVLSAYLDTYIREEIREESVLRREPPFLRFLALAGQLNGQTVNGQNLARDAAVPRSSVDVYFAILVDTLLGDFLPAWQPRLTVRERAHPKFYWFDPGVARAAAGLLHDPVDRLWQGCALETLVLHELRTHNEVRQKHRAIAYYRTAAGAEIDFVIETRKRQATAPPHVVGIEVKLAAKWDRSWERSLRSLQALDGVVVDRSIGVYLGARRWHYEGFDVLPLADFLAELHVGRIF